MSVQPIFTSVTALASMRAKKPAAVAVTIPIDQIPASAQFALVSISSHPVAKAVTAKLRHSTIRYNITDFDYLRHVGLAERGEGQRWHVLTDEGRYYARAVATSIARTLGMHEVWYAGESYGHRSAHCTCGWSSRLYSPKDSAARDFNGRVLEHLAQVAASQRPPG